MKARKHASARLTAGRATVLGPGDGGRLGLSTAAGYCPAFACAGVPRRFHPRPSEGSRSVWTARRTQSGPLASPAECWERVVATGPHCTQSHSFTPRGGASSQGGHTDPRRAPQGADWGAVVTDLIGAEAPPELLGIQTNMPGVVPVEILKAALFGGEPPPAGLPAEERKAREQLVAFGKHLGLRNLDGDPAVNVGRI